MASIEFDAVLAKLQGDGLTHIADLNGDRFESVRSQLKAIDSFKARVFSVSAEIDGEHYTHAFAIGAILIPAFASFDSQGILHPKLRLTLSPYYPTFLSYVKDFYVRTYKVKDYRINLTDLQVVN